MVPQVDNGGQRGHCRIREAQPRPGGLSRRHRKNDRSARNLFLRRSSRLARAESGLSCRWRDCSDDFVAVRGYLDCQKAAFAVAYDVEGYPRALREDLGVMAGSLLGHEAALLGPSSWFVFFSQRPGGKPGSEARFLPRVTKSKAAAILASWWSLSLS